MFRSKKDPGRLLSSAVMLFYFSAFLLIACGIACLKNRR